MLSFAFVWLIIRIVLASCPSGLIEDGNICYTFKKTQFPYDCPYDDVPLSPEDYPEIANDMPHWWAKKDEKYGYFLKFGYELYNFNAIVEENSDGGCFYKSNGKYIISNCNKKDVYGFCVYNKTDESFCETYHNICDQTCNGKSKFKSRFLCGANFDVNDNCDYCDQKYENYPKLEITLYKHTVTVLNVVMKNYKNIITPRYKSLYCYSSLEAGDTFIRHEISDFNILSGFETNEILIEQIASTYDRIFFCEAYIYPDQEIIKSNKLSYFYKTINSFYEDYSFVANITVDIPFQAMPYSLLSDQITAIRDALEKKTYDFEANTTADILLENIPYYFTTIDIRLMIDILDVYPQVNNKITIGFHIIVSEKSLSSFSLEEMYEELKNRLPSQYSFSSCEYCIEEQLLINGKILTFPSSKLGTIVPSKEFLVTTNGLPITRTCLGSFKQGAYWSDPSFVENSFITPSDITYELNSIVTNTNLTAQETNILLSEVITNKNELNVIPYDVYLISKCLERITNSNETYDVKIAVENIESTMKFNPKTLHSSQVYLNATDNILYAYDGMLENQINDSSLVTVQGNQTIGKIMKIDVYNGLAIYERNKTILVEYLNVQDETKIDKSDLIIASFLPYCVIEEIELFSFTKKLRNTFDFYLIFGVFLNNRLFNDDEERLDWQVISLFIPELKYNNFTKSFPVIFGERYSNFHGTICNYWNYGIDDQQVSIFGKWKSDGNTIEGENYRICYYNHMTHFSLMFGAPEDKGVNIITAIVTSLSLICIISIFITAIIFEKWRREESVKVLLHYSGAIMLQDILILIFDLININSILCSIYGILLHFSILAQFVWMLIINYVQYRKLIKVFNSNLSKHTLKFIISAWLLPLIPILIVLSINLNAYQNDTYCFISNLNLYLSLFLPMSLIIFVNILIFIIILKSLFKGSNAVGKSLLKKRISIAILLFFLSGFTWAFGLLANVFQNIFLSYIFCTLSVIQGVILWIFFILMRKDVVKPWLKVFKHEFDITKENRFKIRRPTLDTKSVSNIATILSDY